MHTTMHTVAATREVGNNSSTSRVLQGMHMHTLEYLVLALVCGVYMHSMHFMHTTRLVHHNTYARTL